MKNIGQITLAAWVVTCLLGYFGLGAWLYAGLEGMDRSMVPLAPSIVFGIMVVISIAHRLPRNTDHRNASALLHLDLFHGLPPSTVSWNLVSRGAVYSIVVITPGFPSKWVSTGTLSGLATILRHRIAVN